MKNLIEDHVKKVIELLNNGQTIVVINDSDGESWSNGWAEYLMTNYHYANLNSAMRVNIDMPKDVKY